MEDSTLLREKLVQEIVKLPDDQLAKVLDLVEHLLDQGQPTHTLER